MRPEPHSLPPIALIAGRGDLPRLLLEVFKAQQRPFVVLALKEQTDEELVKGLPHLWLSFGEIGKALNYFKVHHIQDIVMAGTMTRPSLSGIKPDWEGVKWLAKLTTRALGDDQLLQHIIKLIEKAGYHVVSPQEILSDLLPLEGNLTSHMPDEQARRDIKRGVSILAVLSPADVGQAVVVQQDLVLGVEAIEGTEALLHRVKFLKRPGPGGVLIKIPKRGQEERIDLPTIGPETIHQVKAADLRGIAIQAEKTLILKKEETLALAEKEGLFLVALGKMQCHVSP